jgi:hypothetical protein
MGFFSAWENQKQRRIGAESSSEGNKQLAAYNQKRIDFLADQLLAASATNKAPTRTTAIASDNQVNLSGNSGNAAVVIGSPNSPVTQILTNQLPRPRILRKDIVSINIPEGDNWKTQISLKLLYIKDGGNYLLSIDGPKEKLINWRAVASSPIDTVIMGGAIPSTGEDFLVTLVTSEKIGESDFSFTVENR